MEFKFYQNPKSGCLRSYAANFRYLLFKIVGIFLLNNVNSSIWFMGRDPFTIFKYYKAITVLIWSILLLISGGLCIKRFQKQNIY